MLANLLIYSNKVKFAGKEIDESSTLIWLFIRQKKRIKQQEKTPKTNLVLGVFIFGGSG